jgi:hypothetical protein
LAQGPRRKAQGPQPKESQDQFFYPVIWNEQVLLDFVGAACSRDRYKWRLQAAPTGDFF